jgi:hypothetical protein
MKKKQNVEKMDSEVPIDKIIFTYDAKKDLTFQNLDVHLDADPFSIKIISAKKWYIRLWVLISNPFCYLFKGYIRY